MKWDGLGKKPTHKNSQKKAHSDIKIIYAAKQRLKVSGRNLNIKQREEKVRTIGGADVLHIMDKGQERGKASSGDVQGVRQRQWEQKLVIAKSQKKHKGDVEPRIAAARITAAKITAVRTTAARTATESGVLVENGKVDVKLQGNPAIKEKQGNIKTYGRFQSHYADSADIHTLKKIAKNIAVVSYQYGRNTNGQGRGMQGIKSALEKLGEKEQALAQAESLYVIEAKLRVSETHAKEKAKEEAKSSAGGRLKAFRTQDASEASPNASEIRLKTETRRYRDSKEQAMYASRTLHTSKKQEKDKRAKRKEKRDDKKKAKGRASFANVLRKCKELKKQYDSVDDPEALPWEKSVKVLVGQLKGVAQKAVTSLLKKVLMGMLSFIVHVISNMAMFIIMCVCAIVGMIMATLGPIMVVIICVASIYAFLFTSETGEFIDTTSEAYIDNYISRLLLDYRDSIVGKNVNEKFGIVKDYLAYDLRYKIMGEDTKRLSGQVSYEKDDEIMSAEYDDIRMKASKKIINDALGNHGTCRKDFYDNMKMIYFAKMYHEDDISLDDGSGGNDISPYLMIDTDAEKEVLEQIFWEFCTVSESNEKVTWKEGNEPYPFSMTGYYSDEKTGMKYTKADYIDVQVLTMDKYLLKHPLSGEEKKYLEEFIHIREGKD